MFKNALIAGAATALLFAGSAAIANADDGCDYRAYEVTSWSDDDGATYGWVCHQDGFDTHYGPAENDYEPGELIID